LERSFDRGLLVLKSGDHSIRFRPALDITTAVVEKRWTCSAPNASSYGHEVDRALRARCF